VLADLISSQPTTLRDNLFPQITKGPARDSWEKVVRCGRALHILTLNRSLLLWDQFLWS